MVTELKTKIFQMVTKAIDEKNQTIEVVANSGQRDRGGERVPASSLKVDNYMANPVFLWAHEYFTPPIGKTTTLKAEGDALIANIQFAPTSFAQDIWTLYKGGFLNAVSVGFLGRKYEGGVEGQPIIWTDAELLDISAVPVPQDPQALRRLKILEGFAPEIKGVISYGMAHPDGCPMAAPDADWDAGAQIKAAGIEDLKVMCAWVDSDAPEVKSSYKLPHHMATGQHSVVWKGVAAAMAALMGGRGGVAIPDSDRKGVYNHLSKHYAEFEKEPPEFKSASERRSLTSILEMMADDAAWAAGMVAIEGRAISERNQNIIKEIQACLIKMTKPGSDNADEIDQALKELKKILEVK